MKKLIWLLGLFIAWGMWSHQAEAKVYLSDPYMFQQSTLNEPLSNPLVQTPDWGMKYVNPYRWWAQGYVGQGIKIAIIDTGVDRGHADLKAAIAGGISVVPYTKSYQDDNGHGTHVAGIIAAQNNQIGSVGIAYGAKIYAVKALDQNGNGTVPNLIEAIQWCIDNKMNIINMSLAISKDEVGDANFKALDAVIQQAYAKGIYLVAASGNEGTGHVSYPANFPDVIAVGAIAEQENSKTGKLYPTWADFSNYGRKVEVVAPGAFVYSTWPRNIPTFWNSPVVGYEYEIGTSMAAPYVSGFLALLKQKHPKDTMWQLRTQLHQNANPIGVKGTTGFGLIKTLTR